MLDTKASTVKIPRSYQTVGIDYMCTPRVKVNVTDLLPTCSRSLNTDAPGAGKTMESSLAADQLVAKAHAIAVCAPAHLCKQWFRFLGEQFPDDPIVWLSGTKQQRIKDAQVSARWYIFSTQSLRKEDDYKFYSTLFIQHKVDCTIIDESHYVKNPDAARSRFLRILTRPDFCMHVILLSATPTMKEADDLYHQLRIIDPHNFRAHHDFLNKYCWFTNTSWGAINVTFRKGAMAELQAQWIDNPTGEPGRVLDMSTGYILGRSYAEIGLEIPPLISYEPHEHNMSSPRRKVYDDIKLMWASKLQDGEVLSADSTMEVMHMLRRLTNSPEKQQDLTSYIQDDPGPYVIGCFYKQTAKDLALHISTTPSLSEYNPIVITGEIAANDRVALAKQSTNPHDVVIATIPSLAEGCDLSHCNTVYFLEEDYTPGKMYQFLSRVRRHRNEGDGSVIITQDNKLHVSDTGNERPVILRYFHAAKSIDGRIHAVQSSRAVNVRDLVKVELVS